MAVLEIVKAGDPVLKQIAVPIAKVDSKLRKLMDSMAETMYKADGVGLAAPQIGQSIRCVVIDVQDEHGLLELVNPVITAREGCATDSEGCLSVPNVFGDVERAAKVTVEYTNRWNKRKKLTADGLLARCIQHELDHLQGVLFIDVARSIRQGDKKQQ
ncbi:peptide deformylase [Anaerovibrio sp.]|uniref:peptide deformylase n=1 Tax=Anaerovibrio sp. TaxID=1872532 RepID=UPI0026394FA9|nr:peptide deformylase [Anaerovibrio sp.]MDD6597777.1 peptide deformylase [Anaerovibrio sp.]MDD7677885.1 peptide deformylase [Anaerovibrio sp.]MDY2604198.1 peptide deformylase [Anaerovibrio sp.]MDY4883801.1 peptide deformylase [Anaerovibrio sp.]